MKRILFVLWILALSYPTFAQKETYSANPQSTVTVFTLENGLTVILDEDHTKPEIFGLVVTKAGGKDDPADATGMAHYQEHMLFKGTQQLGTTDWESEKPYIEMIFALYDSLGMTQDETERAKIQKQINEISVKAGNVAIPNEFSNIVKKMGGTNLNAGTGWDQTVYYNSFPPAQLEKWMMLYSHRFMEPVFRSFQAELEVVYEEKNMYSDMFIFTLLEKFQNSFFKNHPYGQQTLIGTAEDLKNPSLTKMFDFYKKYYIANNMALVLAGDFNTAETISMVEEYFGKWKAGNLPEKKQYPEEAFKGREFVEGKYSPVKLGLLGFRTVPSSHKDAISLEVYNALLSNSNQTGYLDQLALNNKLLAANMFAMPYQDHGAGIILFVPKIIGQSLEECEEMILQELHRPAKGEFEEWQLEAVKKMLYKNHLKSMESFQYRALQYAQVFSMGQDMNELFSYPEKLSKVSKEDITAVGQKYYGENFLAFYSKMGFPKKDKIDKPGFKPIKGQSEAKSKFAEKLDKIPVRNTNEQYLELDEVLDVLDVNEGIELFCVENPVNEIFSLEFRYKVNEKDIPRLNLAARALNYAGMGKQSVTELKTEFSKIACDYSIYTTSDYLVVRIEGLEEFFQASVKQLGLFISDPNIAQNKINQIYEEEKTQRKMERSEPDNIADALLEYVIFGDLSDYLDRPTLKEIKGLESNELLSLFKEGLKYELEIHYCGKESSEKVLRTIKDLYPVNSETVKGSYLYKRPKNNYSENQIFFVPKKKARQSKIFFISPGLPYSKEERAVIEAFNFYFGGGFSGIVLQEIREYRSMAYSAGARFSIPRQEGNKLMFTGYIGTQADKTNEAIEVFMDLARKIPQKAERMEMIRQYLSQEKLMQKPGFRSISKTAVAWAVSGYEEDPAKALVPQLRNLEFTEVMSFYQKHLEKRPIIIVLVGDPKKIDLKTLESKYGEIHKIKEKKLFSK